MNKKLAAMNSRNINAALPPSRNSCADFGSGLVGPVEIYNCLTYLAVLMYTLVSAILLAAWIYTLYHRLGTGQLSGYGRYLQMSTTLLFTLATLPLLSPATAPLVALVQDLVTTTSMLSFIRISLRHIGGREAILRQNQDKSLDRDNEACPIGTPPCCCLQPCPQPQLTSRRLRLVLIPLPLLVSILLVNLFINTSIVYSGLSPPKKFLEWSNITNIITIPFFFSSMYAYKVFLALTQDRMTGTFPRLRGIINFYSFVVIKATVGIFNTLGEWSWVPEVSCLPCNMLARILLPLAQLALLLPPLLAVPVLYKKYSQFQTGDYELRQRETAFHLHHYAGGKESPTDGTVETSPPIQRLAAAPRESYSSRRASFPFSLMLWMREGRRPVADKSRHSLISGQPRRRRRSVNTRILTPPTGRRSSLSQRTLSRSRLSSPSHSVASFERLPSTDGAVTTQPVAAGPAGEEVACLQPKGGARDNLGLVADEVHQPEREIG